MTGEARILGPKLSSLREKLSLKAKREPKFKFYTLYGLIHREDVLRAAWKKVYVNRGACGIDNMSFEDILEAEGGIDGFLSQISKDLKEKTYRPQAVKRVYIPKTGGGKRPLGIPTICDRIVQAATLLILEPIFEADFLDCSYGFRPGRSTRQAVERIQVNLNEGYREIYDADLQGYFDSIPHDKLIKCLEMRIADRQVLKLIRRWLKATIVETDEDGKKRMNRVENGTPQGNVISPLLANLYLHWFDKVFHRERMGGLFGIARLVRYCDDFVIMAKKLPKDTVSLVKEKLENWMGLKINREKTQFVDMKKQGAHLSFLGFNFRYDRSSFRSGTYLNISPKKKSVEKARDRIREITDPRWSLKPVKDMIKELNRFLIGWGQYFDYGHPSKVFNSLNYFVGHRLYRHLLRRSQRRKFLIGKGSWYGFFRKCGLVLLRRGMTVRANG